MDMLKKISYRLRMIILVFIFKLKNLVYTIFTDKYIILSSSVNPALPNWGDDVSINIIKCINPSLNIIQKKYTWGLNDKQDYLCIGSIITWMTTKRSIIWGSGVVYPDKLISAKPQSVLAVRGPLTREYLIKQGIGCPKIYGDPALLFPRYYTPKIGKKYKIGIIPHFRDKNHNLVEKLKTNNKVTVIDIQNIKKWTYFIDAVNSCEFICSSSLHGIIISDAYQIPNIWIEFINGEQKRFAFHDYYASVNKSISEPVLIKNDGCIEKIISYKDSWAPIDIDLDLLLSVCPFKI